MIDLVIAIHDRRSYLKLMSTKKKKSDVFLGSLAICSPRFKQQNSHLSKIEVNKVFGLVRDVAAKVAAHDTVPGWVVFLVELFLNEGSDVFFDVEFFQGGRGAVDRVLLHVL